MAVKPIQMNKEKGMGESFISSLPGMIGGAVGSKFGPIGGLVGSTVGGAVGQGMAKDESAPSVAGSNLSQESTPLMRRRQQIEEDPTTTLRQGKAALSTMDESTQKELNPVIDEALRRAAEQRKQNGSQSY